MPASQLALGLWGDGQKEPSSQAQGPGPQHTRHVGRTAPLPLVPRAVGEDARGEFENSHSVKASGASSPRSQPLLGNWQLVSGNHQMPDDYRE